MPDIETLKHTTWACTYHGVFLPPYRRQALYHELRRHLGEVFRALAAQPEVADFLPHSGFIAHFTLQGCTRLAVKLDFIAGLLLKAVEATGTNEFRGVQVAVGEVIAWRNLFWGLSDAMVHAPVPWIGDTVRPNQEYGQTYQVMSTIAYPRIKKIIENTVASGLIYLNSHAVDFQTPALRPYLDKYMRGSEAWSMGGDKLGW
jgi:4-hydroxyphenylacetate 3-monooxygenase